MPLSPTRRYAAALASGVVLACAALTAGCSSDEPERATTTAGKAATTPGGTVEVLSLGPVLTWDPQRIASRDDGAFASRVFLRTLTAYAPAESEEGAATLVPDLATDTGTPNETLTQWTFTIRSGVKWEDGSELTCADVAYGISRTFAQSAIDGGPTDAIAMLDIPRDLDGASTYRGPYDTTAAAKAGRAAYAKAVACSGQKITFTLSAPQSDFAEVVSMPAFAAVKESQDKGKDGGYAVFSAGPYRLAQTWEPSSGGLFVRNPHWTRASDPVRAAYPDQIDYREGLQPQTAAQRVLTEDQGSNAVVISSAPPSLHQELSGIEALSDRLVNPRTGVVEYLVPNTVSGPMRSPDVRRALALATNRHAYVTALGGLTTAEPALSLLPAALPATHDDDPVGGGERGDPAAAKALLTKAKVKLPLRITVAYRAGAAAEKAMTSLAAGWTEAGFDPVLKPITDNYFQSIAAPAKKTKVDVFWSNWAPAWASGSTVLPALFDSSINITSAGSGRDYGWYSDDLINARMAKINRLPDREQREQAWAAVDRVLLDGGIYIGLAERRHLFVAGSGIRNLTASEVLGGVVDMARIAVAP